jgi:hypothetical protein
MRWLSRWNAVALGVALYCVVLAVWLLLHKDRSRTETPEHLPFPDFSTFKARERQLTEEQCEALVAQLVNPSKPPNLNDRPHLDLPPGFTDRTQASIRAAYNALSANIEDALPILMKHLDDEQFSYVCQCPISRLCETECVGGACQRILAAHIEVWHRQTTKAKDEEGRKWSLYPEDGEFDWWEKWQGKTLAQLQYEGITWASRQKKPDYFKSEAEWAEAVVSLEEMSKTIRDTRRPIKVEHTLTLFPK